MTATAEKLTAELEAARRTDKVVTTCVWSVAGVVVIYGLGIVYNFVTAHDVPPYIAWMLSPAVDAGLCLGLVATAVLARHGIAAGWVNALRWITALMTLGLNVGKPLTHPGGIDWVGVGIHAAGPILLWVTVEAAAAYQQKIGKVIAGLEARERAENREHTDLTERLHTAEAERAKVAREVTALREQVTAVTAELDAVRVTAEGHRAQLDRVTADTAGERDRVTAAHRDEVRQLRAKHAEALTALRAELTTVSLTDRRRTAVTSVNGRDPQAVTPVRDGHRDPSPAGSPDGSRLTDEDHLAAMFEVSRDPSHEWSKKAVRDLTGVGNERAGRLIQAWLEGVTVNLPSAPSAVAQ